MHGMNTINSNQLFSKSTSVQATYLPVHHSSPLNVMSGHRQ